MKESPFSSHCREKPLCCSTCNKRFAQSHHLKVHQRIHTGEKPYQCADCDKKFSDSSSLSVHRRIHSGLKPYQCQQCQKCFRTSDQRSVHRVRMHTDEKPFRCEQCNKRFPAASNLSNHVKSQHRQKPHQLADINKNFNDSTSFLARRKIHTGDKPYQRQLCRKRSSASGQLSVRRRTPRKEKPSICPQCNKCISRASNLSRHMRIHTGEKPYQCQQCGKWFSILTNLSRHKRTHTGEKPYQCQQCNRQFSRSHVLSAHIVRIHTDKKSDPGQLSSQQGTSQQGTSHQGNKALKRSDQLLQCCHQPILRNTDDLSGFTFLNSKACFPLLRTQDIAMDDLTKLVEVNNSSDVTSFQAGCFGTTPVTLAFLPTAAAIEIVSSSQPCLHPNIAMFYGMTLTSFSCTTVVMENVTTSLSHLLDEIGDQMSLRQRLDIAVGCVSAVDYLHHQLGVSHGLLTCDYVFLSNLFAVKLLDPMVASLINNSGIQTYNEMQDDICHLGHIFVTLFCGVVLSIDPDRCDESGECCASHRLLFVLGLMANGEKTDVPSTTEIVLALESMKQTDQYRQSNAKCGVFYGNT